MTAAATPQRRPVAVVAASDSSSPAHRSCRIGFSAPPTPAPGGAGGRRRSFGFFLSGASLVSDRFLSAADPRAIHDEGSARHAFGRFDWSGTRVGSLNAIVMGDAVNAQIPKTPLDMQFRPAANADQTARQRTLTLGWTRAWSTSVADATTYGRQSRLRLFPADGPLTARASADRQLQTMGAKADVTRLSR